MEINTDNYSTHISQQFNEELEQIRTQFANYGWCCRAPGTRLHRSPANR